MEVEDHQTAGAVVQMASIPPANAEGVTLLHTSAEKGLVRTVKALLEKGAAVDARSMDGRTPLISACKAGQLETARVLLEAGAGILTQDGQGQSPLHW